MERYPSTFVFKPYNAPKSIQPASGSVAKVPMNFDGELTYSFDSFDDLGKEPDTWKMYFRVNTDKSEIVANEIGTDGGWALIQNGIWDYAVRDNNTIIFHDQSLSDFHWYTFTRK